MSIKSEKPSQPDFKEENSLEMPLLSENGNSHSAPQDKAPSLISKRSSASALSSCNSASLKARAKAEAAKVRLEFARKEAELRKQNATQEAALLLLNAERDAAMAEVEAAVLETGQDVGGSSRKSDDLNLPSGGYKERVEQYLSSCKNASKTVDCQGHTQVNDSLTAPSPQHLDSIKVISEVSNMLMKKELVTSGLRMFNDEPGAYKSWKASFKQATAEIKVKPSQEMDLMLKWLGKDSCKLVTPIHSIHVDRPDVGLSRMWNLLDRKYGTPEVVEQDLQQRIEGFPKISHRDSAKLLEYSHLLMEIEYVKDMDNCPGLLHLDSGRGLRPLVEKLPYNLQEKWLMEGARYKDKHQVTFPPFKVFSEFVSYQAKVRNDPSLTTPHDPKQHDATKRTVSVRATEVGNLKQPNAGGEHCPIHKTAHSIVKCRAFLSKNQPQKRAILRNHHLCFKCCMPQHSARECKANVKCDSCGSDQHMSILHNDHQTQSTERLQKPTNAAQPQITSACSKVQGSMCSAGMSCAKIVPVLVKSKRDQGTCVKTYAIIDDQSNKTIATHKLLDKFNIDYGEVNYTLRTCSGEEAVHGRWADDFVVQDIHGTVSVDLPAVTECSLIPDFKDEIPTPDVTKVYDHLKGVNIPEIDNNCTATLLIGRDVSEAHHVLEQRIGPPDTPFAQKLKLGWVIVGEVCLQGIHKGDNHRSKISSLRTQVLFTGRPTFLEPCPNEFQVKHLFDNDSDGVSLSIQEKQFVDLMKREGGLKDGQWTAPLPFKQPRDRLPNNRQQAFKRAQILRKGMERDPTKREHMLTFMEGVISHGHAEVAPPLQPDEECWYLPFFGVYHPKKKDKIRGVFDSSAEFLGHSLNKVLLKGPDLTNDLVGVLMRFRRGRVAVCGDIESMFFCFSVSERHQNFLRFFWHKNNDFNKPLIEFRMRKHVFGNTPSPAVATYGLRDLAKDAEPDVREFINNEFYVDDGLASCDDSDTAISLIKRTRSMLMEKAGVRLHKIASNSQEVLDAFEPEEVQKDIRNLTLSDSVPTQRSLGVLWNICDDTFRFQTDLEERPYTRRGVLSTINGVFDPLGFLAPVMIQARVLFRDMTAHNAGWDDSLPDEYRVVWESWKSGLAELQYLSVPRTYPAHPENGVLHIYCDASEVAVAAVAYLVGAEEPRSGFVFGKSKLAPKAGHTVPRLELCAAVLATEISKVICREMDIQPSGVKYYTDSKIVLGYLTNTTRRFHTYVANRVHKVLNFSRPCQWMYVPTGKNPADCGTRPIATQSLKHSSWLEGPQQQVPVPTEVTSSEFPLVNPEDDIEIRREVKIQVTKTKLEPANLVSRADRFSTWTSLIRAFSLLVHVARSFSTRNEQTQSHVKDVKLKRDVQTMMVRMVQEQFYHQELICLREGTPLPRGSPLLDLSPMLNQDGLICVGGRLRKSSLPVVLKHPVLIPGKSHIARLLVRHYHSVGHPGRQLTESFLREAGFWITGCKRLVSSVIHHCVVCRRLRGKLASQRMADLPEERLKPGPPFTRVGIDCFGPWEVVSRRTRGGTAQSKRWGMIFSCLTSRAVHIEVIEEMSTSSCINALRRFIALRGKVEVFWSDQGSHFVGVMNDKLFQSYLEKNDTQWKLNPPHAPHMGGVWERLIGVTKRILNGILLETKHQSLTHETLVTFMTEVMAIVNARPLVPLTSDPEDTSFLTPSMLLTQKHGSIDEVIVEDSASNMFRAQWKMVQVLADRFWKQWRLRYLQSLQHRRKWINPERNIAVGDVVLLRDKDIRRNQWPLGIVDGVSPGDDGLVRKVNVRLPSTGKTYARPVHELVLLVESG
ncbi:uncharacterized protein LOC119745185 [Patiria miniata]|uniref:Integrase catalytic domain-containing protein n=1 Tax=Patiria miniata TaxID=46514 RepID=A0A914BPC1_PATMI|nr:uncharacterized protein LOC119745185 [Patiria miniata]